MEHFARKMVTHNHPLPHLHFHIWEQCNWPQEKIKCIDAVHDFITSFPDLTDLTLNHNEPGLMMEHEIREILDESIIMHNSSNDLPALWGAHPPDLHPPIEEHLSDVHTGIAAPDLAGAHKLLTEGHAPDHPSSQA